MRVFVRTFLVRRRGQLTVIKDAVARAYEVWRLSAEFGLEVVARYRYAPDDEGASDFVRGVAVRHARRLADEALREGDLGRPALSSRAVGIGPAETTVIDETAERLGRSPRRR